jgi:hypothetical protein
VGRRLRRVALFGVAIRACFGAGISGWPSGTWTGCPATGAATFVHVVERVVDVYSMHLRKAGNLLRRSERTARERALARARAPTARDVSGYCGGTGKIVPRRTTFQESPRGAESARDTGDVHLCPAMARRVTPIPSRVPLTRASRGPHNQTGRRPLYEYRTEPSFAQASLAQPATRCPLPAPAEVPCVTNTAALPFATCMDPPPPPPPLGQSI